MDEKMKKRLQDIFELNDMSKILKTLAVMCREESLLSGNDEPNTDLLEAEILELTALRLESLSR
jgi:hypothetical protein